MRAMFFVVDFVRAAKRHELPYGVPNWQLGTSSTYARQANTFRVSSLSRVNNLWTLTVGTDGLPRLPTWLLPRSPSWTPLSGQNVVRCTDNLDSEWASPPHFIPPVTVNNGFAQSLQFKN